MNTHLKSLAFIIVLGALQVGLFVGLHDGAAQIASTHGSTHRGDIAFGLTLHFALWMFSIAALAIPMSVLFVRSPAFKSGIFPCFCSAWNWLVLPALKSYPFRGGLLFLLGLVLILAFGWVASRYDRRIRRPTVGNQT